MKKFVAMFLVVLSVFSMFSTVALAEEYLNATQIEALIQEELGYPAVVEVVDDMDFGKGFRITIPHRPWAEKTIFTEEVNGEVLLPSYYLDLNDPYLQLYPWESLETTEYYDLDEASIQVYFFHGEDTPKHCELRKDGDVLWFQWGEDGSEDAIYMRIDDWQYNAEGRYCISQHDVTAIYMALID